MKHRLHKLATVIPVALLIAGCSTGPATSGAPAGSGGPAAQAGTTITFMASQGWVKDPELELAKQFETQTGIHVDYQITPADQYVSVLTTKLNSGEAADIFMNQSGKFDIVSQMQIEKNGVDLTDQEWVGRFKQAAKDQVSADGKVYGMTLWDVSDSFTYIYNKKIFSGLGLTAPTSFADFKNICAKILASGVTPIFEPMADGWHHQLNFTDVSAAYDAANPSMVSDLNANKTTFAQAGIFKTMIEQMKEIYDAGYWGKYAESNQSSDTNSQMASGDYAMTVANMASIADMAAAGDKYTADDFGIFAAPYLDNQTISETPTGPSMFIFSGSKNIDAAKQYLAFLAQPENLQYQIDNESTFNSLPFDGVKTTFSQTMTDAIAAHKPGTSTIYQSVVTYLNPQWMDLGKDLASYLNGDMTADEVLGNIDQRRADQAKLANDPNWQ